MNTSFDACIWYATHNTYPAALSSHSITQVCTRASDTKHPCNPNLNSPTQLHKQVQRYLIPINDLTAVGDVKILVCALHYLLEMHLSGASRHYKKHMSSCDALHTWNFRQHQAHSAHPLVCMRPQRHQSPPGPLTLCSFFCVCISPQGHQSPPGPLPHLPCIHQLPQQHLLLWRPKVKVVTQPFNIPKVKVPDGCTLVLACSSSSSSNSSSSSRLYSLVGNQVGHMSALPSSYCQAQIADTICQC
jgi:hypothetical protein